MKIKTIMIIVLVFSVARVAHGEVPGFTIKPFTGSQFRSFIEVFSEMRAPLRKQMMKDRKTDFENADPLKYIHKVQGNRRVKAVLKKHRMNWDSFMQLTGNVLLAYYTIQPQVTKVAIVRRLADYGLMYADDSIPPEYRPLIENFIKSDAGAVVAGLVLDLVLQVPPENIEKVAENRITLDKLFYTKNWRDLI